MCPRTCRLNPPLYCPHYLVNMGAVRVQWWSTGLPILWSFFSNGVVPFPTKTARRLTHLHIMSRRDFSEKVKTVSMILTKSPLVYRWLIQNIALEPYPPNVHWNWGYLKFFIYFPLCLLWQLDAVNTFLDVVKCYVYYYIISTAFWADSNISNSVYII